MYTKIFLTAILIITLLPHSVLAIKMNDDQIKHMAKIIYEDCKGSILTNECPADHVFQNCSPNEALVTSKKVAETQLKRIDNIYGFGIMNGEVMLCKKNGIIIHKLNSTSNCYLWDGECISALPTKSYAIINIGGISIISISLIGIVIVEKRKSKNKKQRKK